MQRYTVLIAIIMSKVRKFYFYLIRFVGYTIMFASSLVKQWCTTAPKKLPTRKEATDEGMVDATTITPLLRGSDVPERTQRT